MADRTDPDLEARLADLADHVDLGPDVDLVDGVLARLGAAGEADGSEPGAAADAGQGRAGWSVVSLGGGRPAAAPRGRPVRWTAAAVVAAAVVAALAVAPAREAVARWLGLEGVSIGVVDEVPTDQPDRLDLAALGRPTTLAEARARVDFTIRVPADLGEPEAYVGHPPAGVTLSWPAEGVVLTEHPADLGTLVKQLAPGAGLRSVEVDGEPGYWVTGTDHLVSEPAPPGSGPVARRRAADVLAWSTDGIVHRLEVDASLSDALALAATIR